MKKMNVVTIGCWLLLLAMGCNGASTEVKVTETDTLAPHAQPRDSGLYPVDSSRYHTDTSSQHKQF
jgi:hypothetical protein